MSESNPPTAEQGAIQDSLLEIQAPPLEQDLIAWRRAKIIELLGTGKSQRAISEILKVSESLISLDVKHLREEARQKHGDYINDLPMRHKVRVAAMDKAISELWTLFESERDSKLKKGILDSITDALLAQAQLDGDPQHIERAMRAVFHIKKMVAEAAA